MFPEHTPAGIGRIRPSSEESRTDVLDRIRPSSEESRTDVPTPVLAAGAVLLLALLPLIPFLLVAWMITRTLNNVREQVSWE